MRALSKVIGILAAAALTASVADARSVNTTRFGGAYDSVSGGASIPYDAEGVAYPTGHGGPSASSDFQLQE